MRIKQNKTINLYVVQNTEVFSVKTDGVIMCFKAFT